MSRAGMRILRQSGICYLMRAPVLSTGRIGARCYSGLWTLDSVFVLVRTHRTRTNSRRPLSRLALIASAHTGQDDKRTCSVLAGPFAPQVRRAYLSTYAPSSIDRRQGFLCAELGAQGGLVRCPVCRRKRHDDSMCERRSRERRTDAVGVAVSQRPPCTYLRLCVDHRLLSGSPSLYDEHETRRTSSPVMRCVPWSMKRTLLFRPAPSSFAVRSGSGRRGTGALELERRANRAGGLADLTVRRHSKTVFRLWARGTVVHPFWSVLISRAQRQARDCLGVVVLQHHAIRIITSYLAVACQHVMSGLWRLNLEGLVGGHRAPLWNSVVQ